MASLSRRKFLTLLGAAAAMPALVVAAAKLLPKPTATFEEVSPSCIQWMPSRQYEAGDIIVITHSNKAYNGTWRVLWDARPLERA